MNRRPALLGEGRDGAEPRPQQEPGGVSEGLTLTQSSLVGVLQQVRPHQTAGEPAAWCLGEGGRTGRALRVLGAVPHHLQPLALVPVPAESKALAAVISRL